MILTHALFISLDSPKTPTTLQITKQTTNKHYTHKMKTLRDSKIEIYC